MNLNNIEQAAKSLLGMQKLSSKQTVYINLPKEDYVEQRTEEVIIEEPKKEETAEKVALSESSFISVIESLQNADNLFSYSFTASLR